MAPSPPVPPGILRRLVFARNLALAATELRLKRNEVSDAEALVLLDASAAVVLRVAIEHRGGHLTDRDVSTKLFEEARQRFPEYDTGLKNLEQLHAARNGVQHKLLIPAESQVELLEREARSAILELVEQGMGIPLAAVSMAEFLVDPLIREFYKRGEESYRQGRKEDAAIYLVACFEWGRFREQQRSWGTGIALGRAFVGDDDESDSLKGVIAYVKTLHSEVEVLKLRLDYKEYRRYADIGIGVLDLDYSVLPSHEETADAGFQHWKSRLGSRARLEDVNPVFGPIVNADVEGWINFAFRFVWRAAMTWQQTPRVGFDEIFKAAIQALVKEGVADE